MRLYPLFGSLFGLLLLAGTACADLDLTLKNLNLSAETDLGDFRTRLALRLGAKGAELDLALRSTDAPADAALCLWLAKESGATLERVLKTYRANRSQGWGALAHSLGIKPGSAAFKRLKSGNLGLEGDSGKGRGNDVGEKKGKKK